MKTIWMILMLCILGNVADANDFSLNQGFVKLKGFYVSVPYESVNDLVIIEVKVAGKKRKFLLDTGAPTVISKSIQKKLNNDPIGIVSAYDFNEMHKESKVVKLDDLKIGDLDFAQIPALVAENNNPVFQALNVEGIIGSNMLRDLIVKISSVNKTVTFTDDLHSLNMTDSLGNEMFLDKDVQSSPVIRVAIGDHISEELLFDTGFDGFYNIAEGKLDLFKQSEEIHIEGKEKREDLLGVFTEKTTTEKTKIVVSSYAVNGYVFQNVVAYSNNSSNSRLGAKLLTHADVTLDYINSRFYLQPYDSAGAVCVKAQTEAYYAGVIK